MSKFNPEGKEVLTYGETLGPAMQITDANAAKQYFDDYVAYLENMLEHAPRTDDMTAEQIARINIGYYAGYYDRQTRERVEHLFLCAHPIFGKVATQ
ncbi:MAG TPA: hypothetical protein VN081_07025 [Dongiaceae bacterium]|nr:hypothetical protein [Dongiaceae bacterium]